MGKHKIEYRLKPNTARIVWAWRQGTKKQAKTSAVGLLDSLRAELGYPKARVWIDGKGVRA